MKRWRRPSICSFTGGKRMVDVEKVRDIIDDIRLNMPAEIRQAKAIVQDRADIVESAKKEAEAIVKRAEDRACAMVAQEAIVKAAQQKATEILTSAQSQSREMRTTVTNYCVKNMLRHTEEQLAKSMTEVKTVRSTLRQSGKKLRYVPPPSLRSPNNALCSARLLETFRGGRFLFDALRGRRKRRMRLYIFETAVLTPRQTEQVRALEQAACARSVGEQGMVVQRG